VLFFVGKTKKQKQAMAPAAILPASRQRRRQPTYVKPCKSKVYAKMVNTMVMFSLSVMEDVVEATVKQQFDRLIKAVQQAARPGEQAAKSQKRKRQRQQKDRPPTRIAAAATLKSLAPQEGEEVGERFRYITHPNICRPPPEEEEEEEEEVGEEEMERRQQQEQQDRVVRLKGTELVKIAADMPDIY
jgi:hypothetical protein